MSNGKKTCFVVMGFGEKTDFQSNPQRTLNMDRTYEDIIEPAVTAAGVECIRADKIVHSTVIDKPMFEQLLEADVVVADLSTTNANAIYELGVRHALRPHATIVIAEDQFKFPFDFSHLSIAKYVHMGKEIGFREVLRMQRELKEKIEVILAAQETDSPVFLFLPELLRGVQHKAQGEAIPPSVESEGAQQDQNLADLMSKFKEAKKASDWPKVLEVLNLVQNLQPNDAYVIQQRALATYKSEKPSRVSSLFLAQEILGALKPDTSSDAETVGLWGAIHKRMWDATKERPYLDKAIRSYARGYFIKDDYYNGINFAFLLNVRAAVSDGDEAIADRVVAKRIRGEVLEICERVAALEGAEKPSDEDLFWIRATQVEALQGMGKAEESAKLRAELVQGLPADDWRTRTLDSQLAALKALQP